MWHVIREECKCSWADIVVHDEDGEDCNAWEKLKVFRAEAEECNLCGKLNTYRLILPIDQSPVTVVN